MYYRIKVAGVERDLPLCPISDTLNIAAFVLFGDVELTEKCAEELYKLAPEHDVMITAESKGIPLIHAMCRLSGRNRYVLARKSVKLYMKELENRSRSILGRKVKIVNTPKKKTLEISYETNDDLEALLKSLCGDEIFDNL